MTQHIEKFSTWLREAESFCVFLAEYVGRERGFPGVRTRMTADQYERNVSRDASLRSAMCNVAVSICESNSYWAGRLGDEHRGAAKEFLSQLELKHHRPLDEMSQVSENFILTVSELIEQLKEVASHLDVVGREYRDLDQLPTPEHKRFLWEELETQLLALQRRQQELEEEVWVQKRKLDNDTQTASESLLKSGVWKSLMTDQTYGSLSGDLVVPDNWDSDTSAHQFVIEALVVQVAGLDDTGYLKGDDLLFAVQLLGVTEEDTMNHIQKVLTSKNSTQFKKKLVKLLEPEKSLIKPALLANKYFNHEITAALKIYYRVNLPITAKTFKSVWSAMPDTKTTGRSNPTSRLNAHQWTGNRVVNKTGTAILKSIDVGVVLEFALTGLNLVNLRAKVATIESDFEKNLIAELIQEIPEDVPQEERERRAKLLYETFFKRLVQKQFEEFESYLKKSLLGDLALQVGITVALTFVPGGILLALTANFVASNVAGKLVDHAESQRLTEAIAAINSNSQELIENYEYRWDRICFVGKP